MARLVRYKADLQGLKRLRASDAVDRDLERRAHNVAAFAEGVYATGGKTIDVEVVQAGSDTSEPRARVAVIARSAAALRIEAEDRVLGGALDAARG